MNRYFIDDVGTFFSDFAEQKQYKKESGATLNVRGVTTLREVLKQQLLEGYPDKLFEVPYNMIGYADYTILLLNSNDLGNTVVEKNDVWGEWRIEKFLGEELGIIYCAATRNKRFA